MSAGAPARTITILATLVVAVPTAHALVGPDGLRHRASLEVATGASALAHTVDVRGHAPVRAARAWISFRDLSGGQWGATWNRATGVPSRIFGSGIAIPGSVSSATIAALHARATLARHIELLAPGASPEDFVLVSNVRVDDMRIIGMVQHHAGIPVVGGQVSFRYKNDRLVVIGSEAFPHVRVPTVGARAAPQDRVRAAREWLARDADGARVAAASEDAVILPIARADGSLTYHLVVPTTVATDEPLGRWTVYSDAVSGAPVAREQTLRFATTTVSFDVPRRYPGDEYETFAAANLHATIDGTPVTADDDGVFTWDGTTATLESGVTGALVRVINDTGAEALLQESITDGGAVSWASADAPTEAQLTTYAHAAVVKRYVRGFAPELAVLDEQLQATVNIDRSCNANSDGRNINFFAASASCENTGRLADVVYHEYGHVVHRQGMIQGVGVFDGAFSEGLSDYLAATITGDPGMGRGFFYDSSALRHLDPTDKEHRWPEDIAEIHYTGLIFAGAMWDLRKALIAEYGEQGGIALADRLFYAAVQRSSNIPSTYVEILAADDDDGDLANGTPNLCLINAAFGAHGLRAFELVPTDIGRSLAGDSIALTVGVESVTPLCPGEAVSSVSLSWRRRDGSDSGTVAMTAGQDGFAAAIPGQPGGTVVRYQFAVELDSGVVHTFPDNIADPWFETYVGEVVELYCNDFESDPFADDWTHGLSGGEAADGADDWQWGTPAGAAGDPVAAYSGTGAIGNDLGGPDFNGFYQPNKVNYALGPVVDVGAYSDVRLHYRRWLTVEDAFFDQATIYANDEVAWRNFNSNQGDSSAIHHTDGRWMFHDVPLSPFILDGNVQLRFEISSDGGLELGGWTIDDVCIVADPSSICGDGTVSGAEECDDGDDNADGVPDACRTNCRVGICGDAIVDTGEECDDGNDDDEDGCTKTCVDPREPTGCGCQTTSGGGSAGVALLLAGLLARRRRR